MLGASLLHAAALGVVYLGRLEGGRSAGGMVYFQPSTSI